MKGKKKRVKKVSQAKENFEIYAQGVERLKSLKKELNSLKTTGFGREEQLIRSQLKNVSDIPLIEREMKTLRLKINKKYKPKKRKNLIKKEIKKVQKDVGEISKVKKAVQVLGSKIDNLTKKGKIDPGVDFVVEDNFGGFLSNIKVSLTERLEKKQDEMGKILKTDLKKRQSEFKDKKRKMISGLNEKYKNKISTSLQREVSVKFDKELGLRLKDEKIKMGKIYRRHLDAHANKELNKNKIKLNKEFNEHKTKLNKELGEHKKDLEKGIKTKEKVMGEQLKGKQGIAEKTKAKFEALMKERENFKEKLSKEAKDRLHKEIEKKEKSIRNKFRNEFESTLRKRIMEHERKLQKKKIELEKDLQKEMKSLLK